ncbi:D-alanyl-D-alanine carboxypeptidase family protein [Tersicoccus sp. Bi-70]|uniref:D-alanyl-D-alanine carboxypeptidase family protein n=1 Tax=Tersicoccus sp. Bi-70 TaxID=1897634 RepID=UPI0009F95D90|nr:D-alanyl-D-alanine carboxypeptidase family protein [Tersicoccus sp. Bi-70]
MVAADHLLPCSSNPAAVGRRRWSAVAPRRLAALVAVVVAALQLVGIGGAVAATPISDPTNVQVLVNKQRPLNPLRYVPPDLVWGPGGHQMRSVTSSALGRLYAGAAAAGSPLATVSAYRSYDQQAALFASYVNQYGLAYAETISAHPGHSEHQTGLAVDVGNADGSCFGNTPGGRWVAANAWRYGFIVRYPNGYTAITGYTWEPWHLRYVGPALAADMRNRGIATMEQYFSTPPRPAFATAADLGAIDPAGTLWSYPATGRGTLGARVAVGTGWGGVTSGAVVDWNGDGRLDVIGRHTDGTLWFYPGRSTPGLGAGVLLGTGWNGWAITPGPWVNGRATSIIARGPDGVLYQYPNVGNRLGARTVIGRGWGTMTTTMVDVDGDGRQDLIAKRTDGLLLLYRGNGAGGFVPEARAVLGRGWNGISSVSVVFGFAGAGSTGVLARTAVDGGLSYYPLIGGRFAPRILVGSGWSTYRILT